MNNLTKEECQLEEAWQHKQPYIKKDEELKEMCSNCEAYYGEDHDYTECRNRMCFKFYLAHVYLSWSNGWS